MYDLYDDSANVSADLDAEIDLLLKSENIEPTGDDPLKTTGGSGGTQTPVVKTQEEPKTPAPLTINLPPELLTQGSALATLAEQYLSGNAKALEAISKKLEQRPTESAEEKSERVKALVAEFFTDPEKAIEKLVKPAAAPAQQDLTAALIPAYEAKGDRVIERFLTEMRDSQELAFDKKLTTEIEKEFWSAAKRLQWAGGSVEAAIGAAKHDDARQVLADMYARAVGAQALLTRKESTKTGRPQNVAGNGGAPQSVGGVSGPKLEMAKATARGLATGDDGKVDPKQYAEFLKLALGKD